jgi:hypothetical protein
MTRIHTGGCQCGAIRFRAEGELTASVCHCRMCQKAFGAYYAPLVSVRSAAFSWTRGERKIFQSSNVVARGFCGDCGTPLTYEAPDGLAIAHGAFDDPSQIAPAIQYGTEGKLPFADGIPSLPGRPTEEDLQDAPFLKDLVSFQHPDHDTAAWPKKENQA